VSDEGVIRSIRYDQSGSATKTGAAALESAPGESTDVLTLDPGVRVVINRPTAASAKPVLLAFYALPNGGTIEQAIGRETVPGDDWRLGVQHIGAQTQFLRERITDRALVVAYLENDLRSWPAWRRKFGDAAIAPVLAAVKDHFPGSRTRIVLSGHSGGGSLIFGYLNSIPAIPDQIERIAFLDANYAYDTERHRDKLVTWLKAPSPHYLAVLAYDDAAALLDGKRFVTPAGGTWGRSQQMLGDLEPAFPLARDQSDGLTRVTALGGRVKFWLKLNPERKIFHTAQVERNGFIEILFAGTPLEGAGYTYFGERAYTRFIHRPSSLVPVPGSPAPGAAR
jgi:hypothetical protein